ncbi:MULTISPECIES: RNA polymerase sigma factor [unclassified Arcicella]|uniref:RNA polymerase sigma factor n=1 Tax=unclassified Arcicella TaxID=2644986 RepID=UPI0028627CC9|nr:MULTISPECIES: RNA polymerase sigma factor [unclassified Arcicella]MDR6563508.1 RNA polymerase sigma-70 factor (ECF subfamily) [Arcicella sp. BE51]MDR6813380.1 RNA polymerase sigma-70 factor (ECF subfamily) [Arcicella sp. BE140]MDR6824693.1 RNA polymerase sigma-70 factor (ECF subfamily) [Arcicella sp. BE139]
MPDKLSSYIEQFQEGNHLIFEKIYQAISPKMFGVCLRYAADKDEAKDILQESFIKIYHQLKTFRHEGSFEGWAKRIVVNTALEYYRSKTKWKHVTINNHEETFDLESDDDILGYLSSQEILQLIQELPPSYRLVFNLYVFEGLKHREIAEQLGIGEGTSKSNLADARRILQKKLSGVTK